MVMIPRGLGRFNALAAAALCAAGVSVTQVASAGTVVPPRPCHPNTHAAQDAQTVRERGDIKNLPEALRQQLVTIGTRPHSTLPIQAYAEADDRSLLVQYYLLDTNGFEPNVFTKLFPGVNDEVQLTATGIDCGIPSIGAVRQVVEPKEDLPTDPNDPGAFIDVFTDLHGLFVINNESGWYEGWMIHDLLVPDVAATRPDGHAQFGKITRADDQALAGMGDGHNRPGRVFTMDGRAVHLPNAQDHFPDRQTNVVPIQLSMGAFNCLQQGDCHNYWEFNYTTNWVHPLYELPFTGGLPGTYEAGNIGALSSLIPGGGPSGKQNGPVRWGDDPNTIGPRGGPGPRDPDRFEGEEEDEAAPHVGADRQREDRMRFIPSGLANEIFLDTYVRLASFEPGVPFPQRLYDAYAAEVARVDPNGHGVISAEAGDLDTPTDGFPDNARLFLPATSFNRFAVTREINDGMLAPRFAPSQRAWVMQGSLVRVDPPVPASLGRDSDDR
jgi:hypothetical protein